MTKTTLLLVILFANLLVHAQDNVYQIQFSEEARQRFKPYVTNLDEVVSNTSTYSFTYNSDGLKIKGFYAMPNEPGNYPVVIYNRGGNRAFGELKDQVAALRLGSIASWGYIAIASNYRGSSDSEGEDEFGGADVNDILNLLPVIRQLPNADTSRLALYGWSRGGLMTYKVLQRSCDFKAAIIGAGVADAFRNINERPKMETAVYAQLIPDYASHKQEALTSRSPIKWADQLCKNTPILLLHGSADWRVSPKDALEMADQLYENQHPFRMIFFEGGDHGLSEYRKEVDQSVKNFLDHYVRDLKPWPPMEPHGR